MNELYFHEDDYCQIELVPVENIQFIKKEIDGIFDFSEKNKIADGIYSDIYLRNNHPKELEEYKIDYIGMDKILSNIAIKHEEVTTGYSTYVEECKNTIGYNFNGISIFISHNDKYVTHIWFDFYLEKLSMAEDLYKILKIMTNYYDLVFVNWTWVFYSHIKQDIELKNKLIEMSKELSEE
jgi:hypothetical protein